MKKLLALLLCALLILPAAALADDVTEITLWTYPIGSWTDDAVVNEMLTNLQAAYPNIKVKVQYLD